VNLVRGLRVFLPRFASTTRNTRLICLASVSSASIICRTDVHRARSLRKKLHSLGVPSFEGREIQIRRIVCYEATDPRSSCSPYLTFHPSKCTGGNEKGRRATRSAKKEKKRSIAFFSYPAHLRALACRVCREFSPPEFLARKCEISVRPARPRARQ